MSRISLDEAITRTLAAAPRSRSEEAPLASLDGRVLAEDLAYPTDLPPFDYAAMDGYAIRGGADAGARFSIRGESRAGLPTSELVEGAALTISTGAVLPAVLDTVVPWEDVAREGDALVLTRGARSGQHVRRAGEDARRGSPALTAGTRLSSRHLALLATLERDRALVAARPRVAVVCTGDELRDPGTPARPGSIVDSNGPMLAGFVRQAGGSPSVHRVPDREGALEQALAALRADHDAIVTVGGAAEGKHDHVVPALERLGGALVFRGVSIKPGKPVALATLGALPVLAMPGNPGSAFVTFALLGLPLLRAMQGDRAPRAALARAPLAGAVRGAADRDVIVYGALRDCAFHPGGAAPSGSIPGLAGASALARIPAGTSLREGDAVETIDVERA